MFENLIRSTVRPAQLQQNDLLPGTMNAATLDETKAYLESVVALLSSEEDDPNLITARAYEEIKGQELGLAQDKNTSQVLERIIKSSSLGQLLEFLQRLQEGSTTIAVNPFGSHVLETLLATIQAFLLNISKSDEALAIVSLLKFFQNIEAATEEWLQDPHATYVLRALFRFLSGHAASVPKQAAENTTSAQFPIPQGLSNELQRITEYIQKRLSPQEIYYYTCHQSAGPTLQTLIIALRSQPALLEKFLRNIVDPTASPDSPMHEHMKELLNHPIGSHFLEPMLEVASDELFSQIYTKYFRKQLLSLCQHPLSNFVVQRLIANARDAAQVEMIFQELAPHLGEILALGRAGVLLQLLEVTNRKIQSPQHVTRAVLTTITQAAGDDTTLASALLRLQVAKKTAKKRGEKYSSLGIRIAQALLKVPAEAKQLIEGFIGLPVLVELAQDPSGSRLLESLMEAASVNQKKRFLDKFKGRFAELATHKFASHVLDSFFKNCEISQKQLIVSELSAAREQISGNHFGRLVLRNCRVEQFQKKQDQWQSKNISDEKKRKLFAEFLDEIDDGSAADSSALNTKAGSDEEPRENELKKEKKEKKKKKEKKEKGGEGRKEANKEKKEKRAADPEPKSKKLKKEH